MAKVVWTKPALADLRKIIEHVSLDSPVYAERLGIRIVRAPKRLYKFPDSGRVVPEFNYNDIRELIYGVYRIIYVVRPNSCYVVSVIHGSRDIFRNLKPGDWDVT